MDWETPQDLFDDLNDIFQFNLDAAANKDNTKCIHWLGPDSIIAQDSLREDWKGVVWLNCPYGRGIRKWVRKAYEESLKGSTVVCLLPARTETNWFQYCWKSAFVVFLCGRIKFSKMMTPAPFPSCIVIFSQNLPPDADISMLGEIGTIVRPLWQYRKKEAPKFDLVTTVPAMGVVVTRSIARDPEYRYIEPDTEE